MSEDQVRMSTYPEGPPIVPDTRGQAKTGVYLWIHNIIGSVEHYYPFLLGFMVPLLLARKNGLFTDSERLLLRSCGVFDKHLQVLGFPGLELMDPEAHKRLVEDEWRPELRYHSLGGCDSPSDFEFIDFAGFRSWFESRYAAEIETAEKEVRSVWQPEQERVLLIGRRILDGGVYGGSQRRSIPNLDEIRDRLIESGLNLHLDYFESRSLWHQVALFRSADIIIAQHGAVFANLLFCRPGTSVVEIMPEGNRKFLEKQTFLKLSARLALDFHRIWQSGPHSEVNPDLVVQCQPVVNALRC